MKAYIDTEKKTIELKGDVKIQEFYEFIENQNVVGKDWTISIFKIEYNVKDDLEKVSSIKPINIRN